jgi:hypothetical protein
MSAPMIKLVEDLEKKLAGIADEARAASERAQQTLAKVQEVQKELEQVRKRLYATAQTAILPTPKIPE